MAKTTVRTRRTSPAVDVAAWQENLTTAGRNLWLAGLGAVAKVSDQSVDLFDTLVEKGRERRIHGLLPEMPKLERAVEEAGDRVKELGDRAQRLMHDQTTAALHRLGVPSREEIQRLIRRVEQLSAKVEALAGHRHSIN